MSPELDLDLVIFDGELTPAQQRNLEKELAVDVVDLRRRRPEIEREGARNKTGRETGPDVVGEAHFFADPDVKSRAEIAGRLVDQLQGGLRTTAADPRVRAVVLSGDGPTFCAGADLRDPPDPRTVVELYDVLWRHPKPVIAHVSGGARAGGIGLVAAADIALAAKDATFAFSEVRVGVAPSIISVLCLRRMRAEMLWRYALTGEVFDGTTAAASGLVTAAVEPDELPATVTACLDAVRQGEPHAVSVTKHLLRRLPELSVADGLREAAQVSAALFASEAAAEGMQAFRERRPPSWVDG